MNLLPESFNRQRGAIPLYLLLAVIGVVSYLIVTSTVGFKDNVLKALYPKSQSFAAGEVTFTPAVIPISDPEIANPLRGALNQFQYFNFPSGWPAVDQYERPVWKDLEPTRGNYNFSTFDSMLSRAQSLGGKGGFRIMAAFSGTGAAVPQYLMDLMPKGFYFNYPGSGNTYAPDWNDPDFIDRAGAFMQAFGARYNNDPRLGWVEVGFYGDWSEWHVWQFPYGGQFPNNPTGATPMTFENKKKLVDQTVQAFPNKQIIMMTDDDETLGYAMNTYPNMGWRRDCWGFDIMDYVLPRPNWQYAKDRWKTAPVVVESCTMNSGSGAFQLAYNDIIDYHISQASGHNMQSFSSLNFAEQELLKNSYKVAGYRYVLNSLTIPGVIASGATFNVNTKWTNVGVAPIYTNWNVKLKLKNSSTGQVVWEGNSKTNLKTVLPPSPVSVDDTYALPANISAGDYEVLLQIIDPANYYKPLNLAIQGKQSDGSYKLGNISVGGTASSPSPVASVIPTPTPPLSPSPSSISSASWKIDSAALSNKVDSLGNNWVSDTGFIGGTVADRGAIVITGTQDSFIYQTERWGLSGYNLSVPNGNYKVNLHFAETNTSIDPGERVFSINLENQANIDNLDVRAESGAWNKALVKSVQVAVTDGVLNINFTKQIENPMISAIEVLPAAATSPSPSAKPGDVDGNGKVDIFDFNILLTNFGKTGINIQGDLDKNNKVDIFDYNIVLSNFGK